MEINFKTITGRQNKTLLYLYKLKTKKFRDSENVFRVEGKKLFAEAVAANAEILCVAVTGRARGSEETEALLKRAASDNKGASFILIDDALYKKISDESAFEGVMCVIKKPAPPEAVPKEQKNKPPVIILDRLQDAGNVGTILRTAGALLNNPLFILSADCADPYGGKAARASMGALFKLKIRISPDLKADIADLRAKGYKICAATLDGDSEPLDKVRLDRPAAFIFGNEGSGIGPEITALADKKIIIPINENSESLNVSAAAAILMWHIGYGRGTDGEKIF